jgi:hypothetical protein
MKLTCIEPIIGTCIALDFSYVLLHVGRISIGKLVELSLLYLASKRNVLIFILVFASIKIQITKFLLNKVIPQPSPIKGILSFHDPFDD